ncbi:MAG: hypothetical protein IJH43_04945 [Mogibacterium sp.]|nr:hypothetical protein [Mogibacterium sp.]
MDKTEFYNKLDIETIEEFKFYENLSALLEEEDFIEENLIKDLLREVDKSVLAEHMDSFYESFLKNIPDSESDLYILVESIQRMMSGLISDKMTLEDINALAEEIMRFRKWYVLDRNVFDKKTGNEVSVKEARYEILIADFLGNTVDYDFRTALDYDVDGYDVRITDIIGVDN